MQKYVIAFLKSGPNHSQPEEEVNKLQATHMVYLGKTYELGYVDPMVKAERLKIETHSWWLAKGICLR